MILLRRYVSLIFLGAALFIVSCAKEDTTPTIDDQRKDYMGDWKCIETSKLSGPSTYYVQIASSASIKSDITISNFYYFGTNVLVRATVNGSSFTIPVQTASGNSVSGSGTLVNSTTITMNYFIDKGAGDIDTCSAKLTKM